MKKEELIRKTYYDPETGFAGAQKLYQKLKRHGVKYNEILDFMKKQSVYQTNKKQTRYGSYIPKYPKEQYQIDLIYLENTHLNKARYGLCCIDSFSKKADCKLMKRKNKTDTLSAFKKIIKSMGKPQGIYCDEGSEFKNNEFIKYCSDNDIEIIFTLRHAPIVERFNRTLKEMLYKYLQSSKSKTIVNVLPKILKNYNNSYHKTIEMSPNEVNDKNIFQVRINIMRKAKKVERPRLTVGDKVRVLLKQKSFQKKYKIQWSKRVYTIDKIELPYFIINELDRKYLRAYLQKVNVSESPNVKPLLENTREGHLRKIIRNRVKMRPTRLALEESIAKTKKKRSKKKKPDKDFIY